MNEFFDYLIKSSVYLGVFFLFHQLWLRNETFFRLKRYYLLLAAAASLFLPLLKIPSPFRTVPAAFPVGDYYPVISSSPAFSVGEGVLALYMGGVLFFLFRFILRLVQLFRLNARSEQMRINGIRVVLLEGICSTFSFFRSIYICRSNYNFKGMDDVIAHEMVHIKQRHSLDVLLAEFLSIFQWFNPFVWPYKRVLSENHEYLADKGVLNRGCSLVAYQLLIVEQHVGGKLLEFASSFKNSQIKRRITMMGKKESGKLSKWKLALVMPLAAVLVLVFAPARPYALDGGAPVMTASMDEAGLSSFAALEDPQKEEELKKKKELELKEKQLVLKDKLAELEKVLKSEQDPEKKKKLKQMYVELRDKMAQIQSNGEGNGTNLYLEKLKDLEQQLKAEQDPEKQKKLKQMYVEIQKKMQQAKADGEENGSTLYLDKMKKLETMLKAEQDPEKQKKLKQMYLELKEKVEAEMQAKEKALKEKQIKKEEKTKK